MIEVACVYCAVQTEYLNTFREGGTGSKLESELLGTNLKGGTESAGSSKMLVAYLPDYTASHTRKP
jgi:hypothetical protein